MARRFLQTEASSGIVLLAATAVALVWANSPWAHGYEDLWTTAAAGDDLRHWVNDGLMALFFFVVGLEIKGEVVRGQLGSARDAALPVVVALGGMAVPAAIYAVVNAGGDGASGWGIPMATDIAFAVGVLALLGTRVPPALKVLLLALAIVDDVGAIAVIAVAYSDDLSLGWAAAAVAGLVGFALLRRLRVGYLPIAALVGVGVWVATLSSGVHATIAGVALGLVTPARPRGTESVSVGERLEAALHPWTSFAVVPIFALANAGIPLSVDAIGDAAGSAITVGVVAGLVIGKFVGVLGAAWLAVRFGIARLPEGVAWPHLAGMAALAGIGFTVSIFVSGLAFDDVARVDQARVGVLAASVIAAVAGSVLLLRAGRSLPRDAPTGGGA